MKDGWSKRSGELEGKREENIDRGEGDGYDEIGEVRMN